MKYGLPYKGSKNKIIPWLMANLPSGECFVDLFAGGCSVTHAAMLSGKYKRFIANDIDGDMPRLFLDAIKGKYKDDTRWISREDFFRLKDSDPYVRICWSFGNNARNYLYAKEIEPWKKALHFARVYHDCSFLREFGIASDGSRADIRAHHEEYKRKYIDWYCHTHFARADALQLIDKLKEKIATTKEELRTYLLDGLKSSGLTQAEVGRRLGTQMTGHYFACSQWEFPTREYYEKMQQFMPALTTPYFEIKGLNDLLQRLQRLQRLQSLQSLQSLEICCGDYQDVKIPPHAIVYCDPPYKDTDEYACGRFNHERFYTWLRYTDFPVWVSEYAMPDDFVCIARTAHTNSLNARGGKKVEERLYVHERWAHGIPQTPEQPSLFPDDDLQ